MSEYGALVKNARDQKGLTQEAVARSLGRPSQFVWRIEQAKNANPPDPETMRAIWRVLGLSLRTQLISLGYLDEDEMEPGVAFTVAEGTKRADLLALLRDASESDVDAILAIVRIVTSAYSARASGGAQSTGKTQIDRSA